MNRRKSNKTWETKVYNRREYDELTPEQYRKEKYRLQVELLKLQEWVIKNEKRVAIVFEGRDAAGKGSTIKRFIEYLIPKNAIVFELGVPTRKQQRNWFLTFEKRMPKPGQIVFFDRSWYSRALIQPVMGYCTRSQYRYFMNKVNQWESDLIDSGIILIKFYLSVSKPNQLFRFKLRKTSPLKYWKLSDNDLITLQHWQLFTRYKEQMFNKTSTKKSPWLIIKSDNKMIARLNAMRYVLSYINYENKKTLEEKDWTTDSEEYNIDLFGIQFNNLSKEQYELLYEIKSNE